MRRAWILAPCLLVAAFGCGGRRDDESQELKYQLQADTAGLSSGAALLTHVEGYRATNGALRVRGEVGLPDGVRLQISIYPRSTERLAGRVQVVTENHHFETPPMLGPQGPLPRETYRIEYLALFNAAWQSPEVMRSTGEGRILRGVGITRDRMGAAAFYLVEERKL